MYMNDCLQKKLTGQIKIILIFLWCSSNLNEAFKSCIRMFAKKLMGQIQKHNKLFAKIQFKKFEGCKNKSLGGIFLITS